MRIHKLVCILLSLAIIVLSSGCGSSGTSGRLPGQGSTKSVEDVLQDGMSAADSTALTDVPNVINSELQDEPLSQDRPVDDAPEQLQKPDQVSCLSSKNTVDVDLTALSSTMVYAEVYGMMYDPEEYIGKTIKMAGLFATYEEESTGTRYYACIIQDATACCAQGMEFVLTDNYSYPDDYPEKGSPITVVGTFDLYTEGDSTYCVLRNADIV